MAAESHAKLDVWFCITTFRRNEQIQGTLPTNLERFRNNPDGVHFVLVDFNQVCGAWPHANEHRGLLWFGVLPCASDPLLQTHQ